ncbi:MAG: ankyrin repeat domain-containing protein [Motiliproteus sp.]
MEKQQRGPGGRSYVGRQMRKFVTLITVLISSVGSQALAEKPGFLDVLLKAAEENTVEKLRIAVENGVPVDSRDGRSRTALLIATYHNSVEAARFLIGAGADVNAKDDLQDSPYLYAGAQGKLEILKMTVSAGADLESINRYGGTALTPAAHHGHVEVVRYMLTTNVDIDQINHLGWTAILEAVILGDGGPTYQRIVKLLVDAGADLSIRDNNGKTAMDNAQAKGYTQIIKILERR